MESRALCHYPGLDSVATLRTNRMACTAVNADGVELGNVEWGGVGALLTRILRDHTPADHPVLVASGAMLNTPFYKESDIDKTTDTVANADILSPSLKEVKTREPKRKRRRISTLPQCIEAAVKTGEVSALAARKVLLEATCPEKLGCLRWGDMVEAMLQLMQVAVVHADAGWVARMAHLSLSRLSTRDRTGPTLRHLSEVVWALGYKGGYIAVDGAWVTSLSNAIEDKLDTLFDEQEQRSREGVFVASQATNYAPMATEVLNVLRRIQSLPRVWKQVSEKGLRNLYQILMRMKEQLMADQVEAAGVDAGKRLISCITIAHKFEGLLVAEGTGPDVKGLLEIMLVHALRHVTSWSALYKGVKECLKVCYFFPPSATVEARRTVARFADELVQGPVRSMAKAAEALARCGALDAEILQHVCDAVVSSVSDDKQMCSRADHLTNCALQLASCGVRTERVFELLSDLALDAIRSNQALGKASAISSAKQDTRSLARTITATVCRLASAGVNDIVRFQKFAAVYFDLNPLKQHDLTREGNATPAAPRDQNGGASVEDHVFSEEKENESDVEQMQFLSDLEVLHCMHLGNFGTFSIQAMQVTHVADVSMHMHMTSCGGHDRVVSTADVRRALEQFTDPSLPVFVDLGCGRGSFLLTLASRHPKREAFNYLGVDRSPFLLARASGLAARFAVSGRLQFVAGTAEDVLSALGGLTNQSINPDADPCGPRFGRVVVVSVLFPTPFSASSASTDAPCSPCDGVELRSDTKSPDVSLAEPLAAPGGIPSSRTPADLRLASTRQHNTQLPENEDFLFSERLPYTLWGLLGRRDSAVFVESHTEEVAVRMFDLLAAGRIPDGGVAFRPWVPPKDASTYAVARESIPASVDPCDASPSPDTDAQHVLPGHGAWSSADVAAAKTRTREQHNSFQHPNSENAERTKRSATWIAQGGVRADGDNWLDHNPWSLACGARTETEAHCDANNIKVFRCIFKPFMRAME
eukprot:m.587028 g.587028  ORF g.587028 m.587028 type:complete len:989 (-) comp22349_c0_seq8:2542-5508(-)